MTQRARARIAACFLTILFAGLDVAPGPTDSARANIAVTNEGSSIALVSTAATVDSVSKIATAQGYRDAIKTSGAIFAESGARIAERIPTTGPAVPSPEPGPALFFTINQVLAKKRGGNSAAFHLAAINPNVATDAEPSIAAPRSTSDEPFSLFTFRAPEGPLWAKWRRVEAAIQAEAPALADCRANAENCAPAAARFAAIIKQAQVVQGRARLKLINDRVNASLRYVTDMEQWHVADLWSAPLETDGKGSFDTGLGDCEDYAIAKYVALREAGTPVQDLRLLLVRDNAVRLDHAVLAAREDDHWLVLDNRWSRLMEDADLRRFVPLFALNDDGVELFAAPYAAGRDNGIDTSIDFSAGN